MSDTAPRLSSNWRFPQRVAYVVNHSYPYSSDGYAVRTHEVARALTQKGHDVIVFNRPGRPWDIEGFSPTLKVKTEQVIDGVRYVFLPAPRDAGMNARARLRQAEKLLMAAFEVFRPSAAVAVSNWENAEPVQYVARRFGIPFYYEQRGFWEMSQAAREPGYQDSADFDLHRQNDLKVAQAAEAVFTLNASMRDEMVRRGVSADKIILMPNGVSVPGPIDRQITRASFGCSSKYLLGYIGSLSEYEGSGDLIRLLSLLRQDNIDVDLLIVGSSTPKGLIGSSYMTPVEEALKVEIDRLGLAAHVHWIPQVAQDQVGAYYSISDSIIMPRHRTPVTELVSPLKPYAAAAYGVPVFMTDLAPMRDIAKDIYGSLFPEGDIRALADMVGHTLEHGGHPAVVNTLKRNVFWAQRVQPMSRLLTLAAASQPKLSDLFASPGDGASPNSAGAAALPRFDTHILPRVALRAQTGAEPVAAIGPCLHLSGTTRLTRLTRVNLLSELATGDVGCFLIDWVGLQSLPGEWDGLWSIENMRLNRQIMDASRIALDLGWSLRVMGPVQRSKAPLFRTVADVFEEIIPDHPADLPEGAE